MYYNRMIGLGGKELHNHIYNLIVIICEVEKMLVEWETTILTPIHEK